MFCIDQKYVRGKHEAVSNAELNEVLDKALVMEKNTNKARQKLMRNNI